MLSSSHHAEEPDMLMVLICRPGIDGCGFLPVCVMLTVLLRVRCGVLVLPYFLVRFAFSWFSL